jgi:hypothetical protein
LTRRDARYGVLPGVRPVESVEEMARPGIFESDEELEEFLARTSMPLAARLTALAWCVTFVTVGELWQWATMRSWGRRTREELEGLAERCCQRSGAGYLLMLGGAADPDQPTTPGLLPAAWCMACRSRP